MSHSHEQMRKKAEALKESMEHRNSNAMNPRGGKDHEAHKVGDMARGSDAGDMGSADKYSMGY